MSAFGTKRTSQWRSATSAFGGKADMGRTYLRRYFELLSQPAKRTKERKLHEHQRYLSRCFPWQQNQPKDYGMELPARGGTAGKRAGGNGRVEGMGRKALGRDRRHGRTAR